MRRVAIMEAMCAAFQQKGFDPVPLIRRSEYMWEATRRTRQAKLQGFTTSRVAAALAALCFVVQMPEGEERRVIVEALAAAGRDEELALPKVLWTVTNLETSTRALCL